MQTVQFDSPGTYRVTATTTATAIAVPAFAGTVMVFNSTSGSVVFVEINGTAAVPVAGGAPGSMPLAGGAGAIPLLLEKGMATSISVITATGTSDLYVSLGHASGAFQAVRSGLTTVASALDLIFNGGVGFDTLDQRITFTRADPSPAATRFNSSGLLETFGVNLATTSTGGNFLMLTNGANCARGTGRGYNGGVGTTIAKNSAATGARGQRNLTVTSATVYTTTFRLLKPSSFNGEYVSAGDGAEGARSIVFNPFTGVISFTGASVTASVVTDKADSAWWLITLTYQMVGTTMAPGFWPAYNTDGSNTEMAAIGTGYTHTVDGMQIELGSTANAYSPTQGTSTSGPRFDYDPATPAGVTGVELASTPLSGWTYSGAWVYNSAGGYIDSTGGVGQALLPGVTLAAGKTYKIVYTCSSTTSMNVVVGGVYYGSTQSIGVNTVYLVCGATPTTVGFQGGANGNQVRNVSIQEVTFTPRGLLIEESRTNLLTYSRDMTNAAWTKTDVTPARTQVGLDGVANSACLITEGSLNTAVTQQNGVAVTAGATITASFVVKRGNTDWVKVLAVDTTLADGANAWFNLATGAKGTVAARGVGTSSSSTITSLGGGWYRLTVTTIPNGTYTVPAIAITSASADNSATRVSGATYIVDCAQLEVGAFATSIIPTGAATVTRAADNASISGTNFSSWFNGAAGTFVAEFIRPMVNSCGLVVSNLGAKEFLFADNGNAYIGITGGNLTKNTGTTTGVTKAASAYGSDVAVTAVGQTPATTTYDNLYSTATSVSLGKNGASSAVLNSYIRRITYYNTRLPNATLQSLTT